MDDETRNGFRRQTQAVAGLVGFALGDAYGQALQSGTQPFHSDLAEISDATQTMLATCEATLRGEVRAVIGGKMPTLPGMVWRSLCIWGSTQDGIQIAAASDPTSLFPAWLSEQPVMHRQNRHGHALDKAFAAGPEKTRSAGCGVLSRIVGLPLADNGWDYDSIRGVVSLTHNDPAAIAASAALYRIGHAVFVEDQSLLDAVRVATQEAAPTVASQGVPLALRDSVEHMLMPGAKLPPAQFATGALGRAVRAAVSAETFPDALLQAADGLAHDRATICAVTGYLWALEAAREPIAEPDWQHPAPRPSGVQYFPRAWLDRLDGRAVIERMAADLVRAFTNWNRVDVDIQTRFPGY